MKRIPISTFLINNSVDIYIYRALFVLIFIFFPFVFFLPANKILVRGESANFSTQTFYQADGFVEPKLLGTAMPRSCQKTPFFNVFFLLNSVIKYQAMHSVQVQQLRYKAALFKKKNYLLTYPYCKQCIIQMLNA